MDPSMVSGPANIFSATPFALLLLLTACLAQPASNGAVAEPQRTGYGYRQAAHLLADIDREIARKETLLEFMTNFGVLLEPESSDATTSVGFLRMWGFLPPPVEKGVYALPGITGIEDWGRENEHPGLACGESTREGFPAPPLCWSGIAMDLLHGLAVLERECPLCLDTSIHTDFNGEATYSNRPLPPIMKRDRPNRLYFPDSETVFLEFAVKFNDAQANLGTKGGRREAWVYRAWLVAPVEPAEAKVSAWLAVHQTLEDIAGGGRGIEHVEVAGRVFAALTELREGPLLEPAA